MISPFHESSGFYFFAYLIIPIPVNHESNEENPKAFPYQAIVLLARCLKVSFCF
jgi:hypothetical protein